MNNQLSIYDYNDIKRKLHSHDIPTVLIQIIIGGYLTVKMSSHAKHINFAHANRLLNLDIESQCLFEMKCEIFRSTHRFLRIFEDSVADLSNLNLVSLKCSLMTIILPHNRNSLITLDMSECNILAQKDGNVLIPHSPVLKTLDINFSNVTHIHHQPKLERLSCRNTRMKMCPKMDKLKYASGSPEILKHVMFSKELNQIFTNTN